MRIEMKWVIVNEGKQELLDKEKSLYALGHEGYSIYPLDIPLNVFRVNDSKPTGKAIVKEVKMSNNKTEIIYELISLESVN